VSGYNFHSKKPELELINKLEKMIFGQARVTVTRLEDIKHKAALLLVAYFEDQPVGFKLGYLIPEKRKFFSWLGGVHPDHRNKGLAQELLDLQEQYVNSLGINIVYFTTFDRFPAMKQFGKKNGYLLVRSARENDEMKYWYEKDLTQ